MPAWYNPAAFSVMYLVGGFLLHSAAKQKQDAALLAELYFEREMKQQSAYYLFVAGQNADFDRATAKNPCRPFPGANPCLVPCSKPEWPPWERNRLSG